MAAAVQNPTSSIRNCLCQIIATYTMIGVSLFSLATGDAEAPDGKIITLLSSCPGYKLPNPKIQNKQK